MNETNTLERQAEETRGSSFQWLAWALAFVLIVYPLSIGPAAKVHRAFPAARPVIEAVYTPLMLLSDHCRPVQSVLMWYIWGVWKVK